MVIRKMKSFRKICKKRVCIFLSKKWEKQVSTEWAVSPGARSATERLARSHLKGKLLDVLILFTERNENR